MNSLQPELKQQPNAIKTKLKNSKFQSETAVCEYHLIPSQSTNFSPATQNRTRTNHEIQTVPAHAQYPSKSPQIYSTKVHDKIHSICTYQAKIKTARFEVLIAVLLKIQVFWFVTLCRWESNSGRFERPCCRHLQDQTVQDPADEDITNIRNDRNHSSNFIA
jgi:hypothetical protein